MSFATCSYCEVPPSSIWNGNIKNALCLVSQIIPLFPICAKSVLMLVKNQRSSFFFLPCFPRCSQIIKNDFDNKRKLIRFLYSRSHFRYYTYDASIFNLDLSQILLSVSSFTYPPHMAGLFYYTIWPTPPPASYWVFIRSIFPWLWSSVHKTCFVKYPVD